ncbi:tryptophan-rich sensory protein [Candidatus Pacearchaeota archaeon]|nr:MAG: tryptophan-rich sensory protein [Candidatus Pacearchaeota archaeon]
MAKKRVKKKTKKSKKISKTKIKKAKSKSFNQEIKKSLELTKDKHNPQILFITVLIVFSVALFSALFVSPVIQSSWYENIKPAITPPNWIFHIVTDILFFMIALSLYFTWIDSKKQDKKMIAWEFGFNFFLIALWSILFFGLKSPLYAFFDIIFLLISIISLIYISYDINKKSVYLLIPYLIWTGFIAVLNLFAI